MKSAKLLPNTTFFLDLGATNGKRPCKSWAGGMGNVFWYFDSHRVEGGVELVYVVSESRQRINEWKLQEKQSWAQIQNSLVITAV